MKTLMALAVLLVSSIGDAATSRVLHPRAGRYTGTVSFQEFGQYDRSVVSTRRLVAVFFDDYWDITAAPIPDGTLDGKRGSYSILMPINPFDDSCEIATTEPDGTPGAYTRGTFTVRGNLFKATVNATTFTLTWIGR